MSELRDLLQAALDRALGEHNITVAHIDDKYWITQRHVVMRRCAFCNLIADINHALYMLGCAERGEDRPLAGQQTNERT